MDDDKKETMLATAVEYLRTTPPWMLVVHLVYIAVVAATLSTAYVISFHWPTLVKIYEEAHSVSGFSTNLKASVEIENQINSDLTQTMNETGGIRAYVYRYHNGLAAISGVPFFFQTNTNEVISPGTPRIMQFEQRIPVGIHMSANLAFVENRCHVVLDADANKDDQDYYFWQSRGAHHLIRCPIYMPNGDLFGFVGIDYPDGKLDDKSAVIKVKDLAGKIGKLFAMAMQADLIR